MKLDVGMTIEATDGPCGRVTDVVIDPVTWQVTHLVVQPKHHGHDRVHLVPIKAVTKGGGPIVLSWSSQRIEEAPLVEVTDFVALEKSHKLAGDWEVGGTETLVWPYYQSGLPTGVGYGYDYGSGFGYGPDAPHLVTTTYDNVPNGAIEIRRASDVVSSDDHAVGHVDGFVVDAAAGITHLVLDRGHLWGHREITIPLADVASATSATVTLRVSRDAVGAYPSVPFHRHETAA